ncbi:MAG TPA: alanine racemase, partial [Microbacterium sp.]|nr:alanine racemase [Microbacterium sp.]
MSAVLPGIPIPADAVVEADAALEADAVPSSDAAPETDAVPGTVPGDSTHVTARRRMTPPTLRLDPSAIAANIATVRAATASDIMAVVKADGYGHGAVAVAR